MQDNITLALALGIAFSMLWERRTGFASGGLIAPGVLAFSLYDPARIAFGLAISFAVWGILELLVRRFGLYGRNRIGAAMLAALIIRMLSGHLTADPLWFGWVVPGLIAADMQRQGALPTIASLFVCAAAVVFSTVLISNLIGVL